MFIKWLLSLRVIVTVLWGPGLSSLATAKSSPHEQWNIWAASWQNLVLPYANNKGADQPAHSRCLISAFVVRCLDSVIPLVSNLYLASVAAQAGLSLPWSQTPKTGYLVTRLIYDCVVQQVSGKHFVHQTSHLRRLMTKPTKWLCAQRRLRSSWVSD